MVSEEVKDQHVLLWSVCVFCLLPALVNANCVKFEFPTANHDNSSDGEITLSVPENQDVTIPFSLNVHTCNGRNPAFTVTVARQEGGVFKNVCKLIVSGDTSLSLPEGRCGKETGEGNFFLRKYMDRADETEWRWQLSYMGTAVERRVQLRVYGSSGQPSSARSLSEEMSSEAEPTAKDSSSEAEPTAEVTVTSCPVYRRMALGLAAVLALGLALAAALIGWLWRRGRNLPRSGDLAHTEETDTHCTQSGLNDDYLEPAVCPPLPPGLSDNHYLAARVADPSNVVYSEPSFPPHGLVSEQVSGPYASLRMVDVGVSSVYSQIRPHGNQTPQKP